MLRVTGKHELCAVWQAWQSMRKGGTSHAANQNEEVNHGLKGRQLDKSS